MMYSQDDDVRLLAGSALAAFAYNNINQQKEIAEQGGVRFNCFVPFLQSSDEYFRCNASFQVAGQKFIRPTYTKRAASWQNQQNVCAPSENSDQPGHPPSLIRVFAVRSVGS